MLGTAVYDLACTLIVLGSAGDILGNVSVNRPLLKVASMCAMPLGTFRTLLSLVLRFAAPSPIRHACHEMGFPIDPNAVGGALPAVSPGAFFHRVAFRP